jgi:hypothetical protein
MTHFLCVQYAKHETVYTIADSTLELPKLKFHKHRAPEIEQRCPETNTNRKSSIQGAREEGWVRRQ